ncbi:hypothetical protein DUNSADRAFT_16180 [Dunaliella salina]|uniref:Uncharacterized protein n=1 Tax=Dunaliella salina TaxID=3046 RepID=A0ABQ7G440_DUNSA|nr:hypothetical protein DUNSADRAFT_16180 [Dunaliella salina]|eukprot:KAF5829376.1 hypothetical protein DUNSADRAFT_16180 [Dunaliella salina]
MWRSPWYCCLGECSLTDWLACCVVANVPCLAFGWNQERAFKMSWWKEGFRYLAATLVVTGMIFTADHRDLGAASLAVLFMVVFAVLMCSRWWATRRGMLRTNFNIKGTNWGDWCLWLWCPSLLCARRPGRSCTTGLRRVYGMAPPALLRCPELGAFGALPEHRCKSMFPALCSY